jgi:tripartite-type tricarboxylate transporter receptor subunit TctC
MQRRDLLTGGAAGMLASALPPGPARPQDKYPSRTVRLIVPTPAGGVYDLMGRLFIDKVGPSLGTAIVENRAGGNAIVGVTAAALSAPDGYTLLLGSNSTHVIQPAIQKTPYDPVKQFAPISTLAVSWSSIAISPKLGINTLAELIDYAKKNPGKLTLGMRGIGDSSHMAAELLKQLSPGFSLQYIPYSAMAQAVRDLMTGDLMMTVPLLTPTLTELHTSGKIKLLAVSAPRRLNIAPDIPTAVEAGVPSMIAGEYFYLFAPAGTPAPILQQLNDIARTAFTDDAFKQKLEGAGFDPLFSGDLAATKAAFDAERARWIPIAEAVGTKSN